jgi:hypothetical protein
MKINKWFAIIAVGLGTIILHAAEETPVKLSDVPEGLRDIVVNGMAKGAPAKFFKLESVPPEGKWRVEYFRGKPIAYLLTTREKIENGKTNTLVVRFDAVRESDVASRGISEDEKIWDYLMQHRKEMARVTEKPYRVNWTGAPLCIRPTSISHSPHGEHWIHVFVSPSGTNAMATGKGTYPIGTVILKQKFLDAEGTKTDFYTGMRKQESGYNPELGDWEFFTLDSGGHTVTARGKIESCMDCHTKYKAADFVSRRYLTSKEDAGW